MRRPLAIALLLPALAAAGSAHADAEHRHDVGDPGALGSVTLPNSCAPEVQVQIAQGMAMLHSFWYERAREEFRAAAEGDTGCAIAWWGVAMSHWQPLWEPRGPRPEALRRGAEAIGRAAALEAGTPLERGLVDALSRFYADADHVDHRERVLAYERAMQALHERDPDDTEARVLYALALQGSATTLPPDKTYARQQKSGSLLEPVFRSHPDHPGAAHYIIHAYDYPSLAERALEAARRYAVVAPDSPHAQHMPSHIFTRLGLWDESIESNRNVIEVARKYGVAGEELHAMDYLVFAHLQKGEDPAVRQVIAEMPPVPRGQVMHFAGLFAHAAIPARFAVERKAWAEAAELDAPAEFPGGRYAWADAAIVYARALGAARTERLEQARRDVARLASFQQTLERHGEDYWAHQVKVQHRSAAAWLALAEGRSQAALAAMSEAAALEDEADKHPVTPGQIVPAHQLLGGMLLELDRPVEALAEFERVLSAEPNRFGALAGAALAAERAGRNDEARKRYAKLLEVAPASEREEVRRAREVVGGVAARESGD